jgi:hypothetical protein
MKIGRFGTPGTQICVPSICSFNEDVGRKGQEKPEKKVTLKVCIFASLASQSSPGDAHADRRGRPSCVNHFASWHRVGPIRYRESPARYAEHGLRHNRNGWDAEYPRESPCPPRAGQKGSKSASYLFGPRHRQPIRRLADEDQQAGMCEKTRRPMSPLVAHKTLQDHSGCVRLEKRTRRPCLGIEKGEIGFNSLVSQGGQMSLVGGLRTSFHSP